VSAKELGEVNIEGDELRTTYRGCAIRVRLAPDDRGRWRPVEVVAASDGGVGAEVIRTLPLRAIEAMVNRGMARWVLDATQTVSKRAEEMPAVVRPRLRLSVPEGPGRKPDRFYQRVAEAYGYLAETTHAPAAELAELNDVPLTTVHRWVKEARVRGFLAPGQRGRAT
jgi:hypothetical protein